MFSLSLLNITSQECPPSCAPPPCTPPPPQTESPLHAPPHGVGTLLVLFTAASAVLDTQDIAKPRVAPPTTTQESHRCDRDSPGGGENWEGVWPWGSKSAELRSRRDLGRDPGRDTGCGVASGVGGWKGATPETPPAPRRDVSHKPQPGLPTVLSPRPPRHCPSPEGGRKTPPPSCCCDGTSSFPWRLLVGPPLQKPERPRGAGGGQCSCFIESMQPAHRFVKSFCTSLGGPEPWARGPFLDAINFHLGLSAACKQMSAQVWESGGGMLNGPMAPLGQACQCHH